MVSVAIACYNGEKYIENQLQLEKKSYLCDVLNIKRE